MAGSPRGTPHGLFKTESGPLWQEADSLLPETPVDSQSLELSGFPTAVSPGAARKARLALYASHFLSAWGQRAWEFLVGLVMLDIHPSSLLLVSVFGLADAAAVAVLGPAVGAFLDSQPSRLRAACTMYVAQNAFVAVSAASCLALVVKWGTAAAAAAATPVALNATYWALVATAIASGSLSSVGALGASLSVEREWTKALAGADTETLAALNAVMKRIDLTCLIASPIAVGLLMTWKVNAAVVATLAWNLAAWAPECLLLRRAQAASPALAAEKIAPMPLQMPDEADGENNAPPSFRRPQLGRRLRRVLGGWAAYANQPAAPAALALALLYLTVLSFGTLMTAWLYWTGMGEAELSIYRGLGALSGIAATLAFPPLHKRYGLVRTGAAAITAQLLCLLAGVAPIAAVSFAHLRSSTGPPSAPLVHLLAMGLVFSRFGLWGFDLAVNQIIQETVPSTAIGAVTGVQGSLQSLAQMAAYGAGVAVWNPTLFSFLMAGSVGVVAAATTVFWGYAVRSRGDHRAAIPVMPETLAP